MAQTLTIIEDPLDKATWTTIECDSVAEALSARFDHMPAGARLYRNGVGSAYDITPTDEAGVVALENLPSGNHLYFVNYPAGPIVPLLLLAVVVVAAIAILLLIPALPTGDQRNQRSGSGNNSLTNRGNGARPLARIPDIFGTVRAYPDLISLPYSIYVGHRELEISSMCVGRGEYVITDVRDGDTPVADINGTSVAFYKPGNNASKELYDGTTPQLVIGNHEPTPLQLVTRVNDVNGQTLLPPNNDTFKASGGMIFRSGDTIEIDPTYAADEELSFEDYFVAGDEVVLSNTTSQSDAWNFNGTYTIINVNNLSITFQNPAAIRPDWDALLNEPDDEIAPRKATITKTLDSAYQGWFVMSTEVKYDRIVANFIAPNGLYKDDGEEQRKVVVSIEVQVQECTTDGTGFGPTSTIGPFTLHGSSKVRTQRAKTVDVGLPFGKTTYRVRARRVSNTDKAFKGTVVDNVKWGDCYAVDNYGGGAVDTNDVTTLIAKTYATATASAVKERRLSMLVTRKIESYDSLGTPTGLPYYNLARNIVPAIWNDPHLGNQPLSRIDFDSLATAHQTIQNVFGGNVVSRFGYTFDDLNMSAEEMISVVCDTCFIKAYRQGQTLMFRADVQQEVPRLLFNVRNKMPGTEKRTITFGNVNDHDGVAINWTDLAGTRQTVYLPDNSAIKPKKVELNGVSTIEHATVHAWRIWNKIQYQNTSVRFEALQEAALLSIKDLVLVTDGTRADSVEGEVVDIDGNTLTVSSTIEIPPDAVNTFFSWVVVHLQHKDGTVSSHNVTSVSRNTITISGVVPTVVIDPDSYARTTFVLVQQSKARAATRMLINELSPRGEQIYDVDLINDDPRYYSKDGLYN